MVGIGGVIFLFVLWQASAIASDYWLAYETSEERAQFFNPSVFISIYAIIVVVSVLLIVLRSYSLNDPGVKDKTYILLSNSPQHLACPHVFL